MNAHDEHRGFPTVKPRKQKNTPSRRAAEARRLMARMEAAAAERREAWAEGHDGLSEARTDELAGLHDDKRAQRRAIYDEAPALEGTPVYRHTPGGLA